MTSPLRRLFASGVLSQNLIHSLFLLQIQKFIGDVIKTDDVTHYLLLDLLSLLSHIPRLSPENTALVSRIISDDEGNGLYMIFKIPFKALISIPCFLEKSGVMLRPIVVWLLLLLLRIDYYENVNINFPLYPSD